MLERKHRTWICDAHRGSVTEGMHENTLSAFMLAAERGADLIETDARTSLDGMLICNHDPIVKGFDENGNAVEYEVSKTHSDILRKVVLAPDDPHGVQYVPTLREALSLCYRTGMSINIDLKEGLFSSEKVARLVLECGMRGRVIYATNGSGAEAILKILEIDPEAHFIDTPKNYTYENLKTVPGYGSKCYAYTANFSKENIDAIRASGCMLAAISIRPETAEEAFALHPDLMEYLHTSDFAKIESTFLSQL